MGKHFPKEGKQLWVNIFEKYQRLLESCTNFPQYDQSCILTNYKVVFMYHAIRNTELWVPYSNSDTEL